jgi:pimeloyl-ACP methyl ester carboxylesterase
VSKLVATPFGEIAYYEQGSGPAALFVHGVFLNGRLWRNVISRVKDARRCIAIDLMAHGSSRTPAAQDLSMTAHAEMLEAFCEALGLDQVDVVGNDSGGGIAQIFAALHPERIRSLTLTNCDVHDNWPPEAFQPTIDAVRSGALGEGAPRLLADVELGREAVGVGYEHPELLSEETVRGVPGASVRNSRGDRGSRALGRGA